MFENAETSLFSVQQNLFTVLYVFSTVVSLISLFVQRVNYCNFYNLPFQYRNLCDSNSVLIAASHQVYAVVYLEKGIKSDIFQHATKKQKKKEKFSWRQNCLFQKVDL